MLLSSFGCDNLIILLSHMNVRLLLPLLVCLACTPTGMERQSAPPVPGTAAPAWEALAGGPDCQSRRADAERLRERYPALATHVTGAWLLCALSTGDLAAATSLLTGFQPPTGYPDWDAAIAWAQWIAGSDTLPRNLPRSGREVITQRAIRRAMAMPLTDAADVFSVWPEWDWPELFEREVVSMLPATTVIETVRRLTERGRRQKAWNLLQRYWAAAGLSNELALTKPDAWCRCDPATIYALARLAFDLREYPLAAVASRTAATGPFPGPAILLHGRALARQGRTDEATRYWLRELQRVPDADSRAAILYRLGLLAEDRGHMQDALKWYQKTARVSTSVRDRDHAGFRAGWLKWRAADQAGARAAWREDLDRVSDPVARRRLLYWLGKADPDGGWHATLFEEAPLSWYAWLAAGQNAQSLVANVHWFDSTPAAMTSATEARLASTRLAMQLGWLWPARFEFEAALSRTTDPKLQLALLGQAERVDLSSTALKMFWSAFGEPFRQDPPNFDRRLWRIVYPRPFAQAVTSAARKHQIDPALIYAVMREESHFQPEIISPAGAVGLLQLMPATATRLALSQRMPAPSLEHLFVPDVNISLGAAYLRQLLTRFSGAEPLAIASYNAGPAAVSRWTRRVPATELDRFVEEIPYTETRRYVIKVTRSLIRYRALMASES
ncbi:MAG: hypothetical protein D6761_07880 [Candidatus Dadabacteria bacterium]|nr:MAG: hypothetical protein D6761_07880 [Candidatus Dadabacteria bacterium]